MSSKYQQPADQTIERRDPAFPGHRNYTLSSAAYNRLIAKGVDPQTVAEAELGRRAKCIQNFDDAGRIIMTSIIKNFRRPKTFTYTS